MSKNVEQLTAHQQRLSAAEAQHNRIQGTLAAHQQRLAPAMAEAEELFGTSNLDELREKLIETERTEAALVQQYGEAVTRYVDYVAALDRAMNDPEALAALILSISSENPMQALEPATADAPAAAPTAPAAAPATDSSYLEDI